MKRVPVMLAHDYKADRDGDIPCVVMPKLDGVRARYVPGVGFVSRDQIIWNPAKLAHIKPDNNYEYDGELYVHGWLLQRINGAVSINSIEPSEDTPIVRYHIYDLPGVHKPAEERMELLDKLPPMQNVDKIEWKHLSSCCNIKKQNYFASYVARGYEGAIYKHGYYEDGRSYNLLRLKQWETGNFDFLGVIEGTSKNADMAGAIICRTSEGKEFKIGTGFSNDLAIWLWVNRNNPDRMPKSIHARYQSLSADRIPLKASFLSADYK